MQNQVNFLHREYQTSIQAINWLKFDYNRNSTEGTFALCLKEKKKGGGAFILPPDNLSRDRWVLIPLSSENPEFLRSSQLGTKETYEILVSQPPPEL